MEMKRRIGGSADGRIVGLVALIAFGLPLEAHAQTGSRDPRPWPIAVAHYAKWPGLAATGAFLGAGFVASQEYRDARAAREQAIAACDFCPYMDGGREDRFRARARTYLIVGQGTLLATAAMFVADLMHRHDGPRNIPFAPLTVYAAPGRVGLKVTWP